MGRSRTGLRTDFGTSLLEAKQPTKTLGHAANRTSYGIPPHQAQARHFTLKFDICEDHDRSKCIVKIVGLTSSVFHVLKQKIAMDKKVNAL